MYIYLQDSPNFCIIYARTNVALRDIPLFPCMSTLPPNDKHSSINCLTFAKCGMIFSLAESAMFSIKYLNLSRKCGRIKCASRSCRTQMMCVIPLFINVSRCDFMAAACGPRNTPGIISCMLRRIVYFHSLYFGIVGRAPTKDVTDIVSGPWFICENVVVRKI